jgi:hypothetical protein
VSPTASAPHRAARAAVVAALTLGLVVTGTVTAGQAPAAAATVTVPPAEVLVAPSTVTLTRKQTATTEVTLRIISPEGQRLSYRKGDRTRPTPAVVDAASGARIARTALTLVSGDRTDGIWQATLPLGAALDGVHPLTVEVCPGDGSCIDGGPVTRDLGATVTVNGSDWPVLARIQQRPSRLPAGRTQGAEAVGTVVFSDSREPAPRVSIGLQRRPGRDATLVVRSGSQGTFRAPWPWPNGSPTRLQALTVIDDVGRVVHDAKRLGMPRAEFAVRTHRTDPVIKAGQTLVVTGTVSPGYPAKALGRVLLERRTDKGWHTVDRARLKPVRRDGEVTKSAAYRLTKSFNGNGTIELRVRKPGARCGGKSCVVKAGTGKRFSVIVGNRTYFVERKLARLGVPVGAVDGNTDARTKQALCAWRDVTGRTPSRAGLTKNLTRSIMNAQRLPRAGRGDGLYVNKTCQVLFQVVDNRYRRIVWVSTGKPGYDTPNGTGAIYRKLKGPIESTLYPEAYMYDPMFFLPSRPGIALHGSASNSLVLPYPASHGCIRVWRPEMHRIFEESPIGTKVSVYGKF